jgi:AhpD family alkylhydroperoxidase
MRSRYGKEAVMPYISPPVKIPLWLRFFIWIGDKAAGKKMEPSRALAHYPKALISSGIFESLVTHHDRTISRRVLQLVRMQVSFSVSCAFCIDMNSQDFRKNQVTDEEIEALQGTRNPQDVISFSERERTAIEYTRAICSTPLSFEQDLIDRVTREFSEREMVILASTAAQVNYWTRLIQALGIPPAGFNDNCPVLKLDRFRTLKR